MMAISRINNENEFMISLLRSDKGGLDESSPYINIGRHDGSSPFVKNKMGMMNQALTELTTIPGGIKQYRGKEEEEKCASLA
jgi:hypothetical protein